MIDLEDVQSMVLRPGRVRELTIWFLSIGSAADLSIILGLAAKESTSAQTAAHKREGNPHSPDRYQATNIGVTAAGLRLAGITQREHDALPSTFTRGMRSAAAYLGDVGPSSPAHWDEPFGGSFPTPVHVVVFAWDGADPSAWWAGLGNGDLAVHPPWRGRRDATGDTVDDREPFGFRDNVTDPVIEGSGKPFTAGNGVWDTKREMWRPVRAGEALLGYVDENGAVSGHPDAAQIEHNGSYVVVRKLEQDVAGFHESCRQQGAAVGLSADELAARLVGRHQNGTVVGGHGGPGGNDFHYGSAPELGVDVAPSAHIRRANPRSGLFGAPEMVARHLLFRRGIPYSEPSGPGLLFLACCADLHRQFEFVQQHWLQDGNRFQLGRETDPLVGQRGDGGPVSIDIDRRNGSDGRRCVTLPSFVTTKGGEYLLLPSRRALRLLASRTGKGDT